MDIVTIAARAIFQFLQDDSTVQRAEPVDVRGPDLLRGARSPGWRALGPPLGVDRAAVRATRPSRSELNDTQTLLDLVEVGLGVAVVPEGIAAPRGARIRQIAIRGRR